MDVGYGLTRTDRENSKLEILSLIIPFRIIEGDESCSSLYMTRNITPTIKFILLAPDPSVSPISA